MSGDNSKVAAVADSLAGMQQLTKRDEQGLPYIMVDGERVRTRLQLKAALSRHEQRRMAQLEQQCHWFPQLEKTAPPPGMEADSSIATACDAMNSMRASEEELQFQADLKKLTLQLPEPPADAPIAHAGSTVEHAVPLETNHSAAVLKASRKLQEIRLKLLQLRREQQQHKPATAKTVPDSKQQPMHPPSSIQRQATFDIKLDPNTNARIPQLPRLPPAGCLRTLSKLRVPMQQPLKHGGNTAPLSNSRSNAVTSTSTRPKPDQPSRSCTKRRTTGSLQRKQPTTPQQQHDNGSKLCTRPMDSPLASQTSAEQPAMPELINQIGELFVQLQSTQLPKQQQQHGDDSHSYLVTISPKAGKTKCAVQEIPVPESTDQLPPTAIRGKVATLPSKTILNTHLHSSRMPPARNPAITTQGLSSSIGNVHDAVRDEPQPVPIAAKQATGSSTMVVSPAVAAHPKNGTQKKPSSSRSLLKPKAGPYRNSKK